jgi:hypothetical protein
MHKLHLILYLKSGMIHLIMRRMHLTFMKMLLIMKEKVCNPQTPLLCVQNHI